MLRFGTDGIRGRANDELSPELALGLGRAAARVLAGPEGGRRLFLVGRDTRRSGPMLQAALAAGLLAEGVDVADLGVMPTPAVAAASAAHGVPAAMISASHNPYWDNGIKFFLPGGKKLPDQTEEDLEAELSLLVSGDEVLAAGNGVTGRVGASVEVGAHTAMPEALGAYIAQVVASLDGRSLRGLKVVLDCANGAACTTAASVFGRAGADVVEVIGASPDGTNINDECGSTHPQALSSAVVARGADLGLAFDGDADRVIAVTGAGEIVDGDRLLALFATDLAQRGELARSTVVVTVMSNIGFHRAMAGAGISVHTVSVGDRYVLEALDANGWSLGGEQSGHIVFRSLATTGDGVLSGLLLADLVVRRGRSLAELSSAAMEKFPQVLRNVTVADRHGLAGAAHVWAQVRRLEEQLAGKGRIVLRPSGTEPLVRVMVEAPTAGEAEHAADLLVGALHEALGPGTVH
ncbi:MAG TPA: phosphoglucosamine mutase [Acidimicrobiales bacterium]|nr:phosphoglucosamine mutase [Acidimicrobiales bacterium]